VKLAVNLALAAVLWLLAGPLSSLLGSGAELVTPLRWAAVGSLGSAVFGAVLAVLQARQRFLQYALLRPLPNLLKVGLLILLWRTQSLTLVAAVAASSVVFFLALAAAPKLTSLRFLTATAVEGFSPARGLAMFSAWIVLSKILFALYSRIDVLLIEYFGRAICCS
jgi:O-antigen/teichoic acid export membrane protein